VPISTTTFAGITLTPALRSSPLSCGYTFMSNGQKNARAHLDFIFSRRKILTKSSVFIGANAHRRRTVGHIRRNNCTPWLRARR
jgi:hypothetical protein